MADDIFRLPASSYEELVKIIRAYGSVPDEASLTDVSKASAINSTTISKNSAFFASSGLTEGGQRKKLTPLGRALAKALDYEMPQDIESGWAAVVGKSEFMQQILSAVRIRNGMELAALKTHVAYTAGQPKKPSVLTGAGTVVDILKAAGRLAEHDGKLVVRSESAPTEPDTTPASGTESPAEKPLVVSKAADQASGTMLGVAQSIAGALIHINVNVNVECSPTELEVVGQQLRTLIEGLLQPEAALPEDSQS